MAPTAYELSCTPRDTAWVAGASAEPWPARGYGPQPRSFVPRTTDSAPNVRAAPNLLLGQPAPSALNQVWVGVTTYLPKLGGSWLYLATWLNRYSRKIMSWDVRESTPEALVSEALRRALAVRQPAAGLVVHSDQGSQCSATNFKALVTRH